MYVRELRISHFRGFDELTVKPKGHVILMGEPGAGRSDLIEALSRVLDVDASRNRTTTELDFHRKDTSQPAVVSVTLGGLGDEVEQLFLDYLEVWDTSENSLVAETETPESIDEGRYEWALRLEYRAQWLHDEERCEEFVYFPKASDPSIGSFAQARRRDIEQLGFTHLRWEAGRVLDLGARSPFRRLIEQSAGDDFVAAIAQYVEDVAKAAARFTESSQIKTALDEVLGPLRDLLGLQGAELSDLFRFAPEGGSLSGLLRTLGPAIDLGDGIGALPAWRRGTTTMSLLRIAEALAVSSKASNISAIDDLGDGLDPASATHLAEVIRRSTGQVWISTRLPSVAEIFEPQEVVRLGHTAGGKRFSRQGRSPATRAEAIAAKHWHRNLLPALSYRSVVVLEGPNDFATLHALASRLSKENNEPLPATRGVSLINAGITGSGGYANVLRLAGVAREMGLRAVGVVDGDTSPESLQFLHDNASLADAVIRLPDGAAIELAVVQGVPEDALRQAMSDAALSVNVPLPSEWEKLSGKELEGTVISFIKKYGLHAPYVEALPLADLPPLAVAVLRQAVLVAAADASGLIQL